MSGDGSGPASRRAWPVRTLRLRPACRRLSEQDGSERRAACHQPIFGRSAKPHSERYLSLCRDTRGACDSTCARCPEYERSPGRWGARHRYDLAGAATQCRDAQRRPGLSCNHSAVACRPGGPAPETREAGGQPGAARVCAGSIGRCDRHPKGTPIAGPSVSWKGRRHGPRQDRRWASAWSPEQIVHRLRLDFPDDKTMRIESRSHLPVALRARPWRSAPRADGLFTDRACVARTQARTRGQGKAFIVPEIMISERPAKKWVTRRCLVTGKEISSWDWAVPRSARWWSARRGSRCFCTCRGWPEHGVDAREKKAVPRWLGMALKQSATASPAQITSLPEQLRRSLTWDQGPRCRSMHG